MMMSIMLAYFLLLLVVVTEAADHADEPLYFNSNCTITRNFTASTPYQFTRATLLTSLSSHATANTYFYNTTKGTNKNDTVYGLFMCRGDVPSQTCQDCVERASKRIVAKCPHNKEAIVWYDQCMLRYSDRSFFSTLQTQPTNFLIYFRNINVSDMEKRILKNTVNDVVEEAAKSKFAIKEANVSNKVVVVKTLYTLVQCTPDLSTKDCYKCLRDIIPGSDEYTFIGGNQDFRKGEMLNPSCIFMFGWQRFYYKHNALPVASIRSEDVTGLMKRHKQMKRHKRKIPCKVVVRSHKCKSRGVL